jgi:hypothetical protein
MPPNGSWVLALALGTVACGLTVVGEPAPDGEGAAAEAPLESRVESRAPTAPCIGCDAGSAEAGKPSAPVLACETYRACPSGSVCCYDAQTGSRCAQSCAPGAIKLCRLGVDRCGDGEECDDLAAPPASGVGACVPD